MFDTRKTIHNGGILDVIKILSANGESGRLEVSAGTTEGAFFFRNGQLVDARVGHLRGFPAVNAVASMPDARFSFDPSVAPPLVSSITPNERVVLKQFFGIETVDPNEIQETPTYAVDDEVTIETTGIPVHEIPITEVPDTTPVMPDPPASRPLYRGALVLALLFILIAAGAVALRNKYRERTLTPSVATTAQQPQQPVQTQQPAAPVVAENVKADTPSTSTSVEKPVVVARDLTGKWNVVNSVQKTSYRSFENLQIGFQLSINQNGKSFTGAGRKVSENGRSLPASSRTPIQLKGSIEGDRVEATFFEEGTMRKTSGRFVWRIDRAGAGLNGTFVSNAAGSSGRSAAKKEL